MFTKDNSQIISDREDTLAEIQEWVGPILAYVN